MMAAAQPAWPQQQPQRAFIFIPENDERKKKSNKLPVPVIPTNLTGIDKHRHRRRSDFKMTQHEKRPLFVLASVLLATNGNTDSGRRRPRRRPRRARAKKGSEAKQAQASSPVRVHPLPSSRWCAPPAASAPPCISRARAVVAVEVGQPAGRSVKNTQANRPRG